MSPNGDFEDNFGVYEDLGVKSTSKPENSAEADVENEDDADDDDSGNASEGGEDASRTESGGDECSQDENIEEEDGEHDEIGCKAEGEGEAEGIDAHLLEGDSDLLPQSERGLLSVRPLLKHVSAVLRDEGTKDFQVFYGNDDFYVLFRLHQVSASFDINAGTKLLTNFFFLEKIMRTIFRSCTREFYLQKGIALAVN